MCFSDVQSGFHFAHQCLWSVVNDVSCRDFVCLTVIKRVTIADMLSFGVL